MTHLYIFNCTEDGINCNVIERQYFGKWVDEHANGIRLECQPKFIDTFPSYANDISEYFIIEGKCLLPKPINVVKKYTLP